MGPHDHRRSLQVKTARPLLAAFLLSAAFTQAARSGDGMRTYLIIGDAIPRPLTGEPGDAVRGRAIVTNRQQGLCLLCHSGPFPEATLQGTLAPSLAGAGAPWSAGQLRLRIVDASRPIPTRSCRPIIALKN